MNVLTFIKNHRWGMGVYMFIREGPPGCSMEGMEYPPKESGIRGSFPGKVLKYKMVSLRFVVGIYGALGVGSASTPSLFLFNEGYSYLVPV